MSRPRREKPSAAAEPRVTEPDRGGAAQTSRPSRRIDLPSEQARGLLFGGDSFLEGIALLVLLALIPLRAIASETHTFEVLRWLRSLEAPGGATPAATLGTFAVIVGAAIVVLCVRLWRGGSGYRRTGAEAGLALLVVAGVISTWIAGQKHLALTGVLDFLGLVFYVLVLRQLLTRPWHVRLALTVILATGVVIVTKCAYQRLVEMPMTIEYYQEHKTELTQGDAAGGDEAARAGALYDYEQRLYARTVSGYFQHPNVLASYLILIVTTSLAVAVGRFRRRRWWTLIVPLVLAAGAIVTFAWAQSKGAVAALGAALALWAVGGWVTRRRPTPAMRRRLVIALGIVFILGAVGLVALLKAKPDALGRSMLFRSMYWQGAWNMLVDRGPWGVGADNFGRYFMRYKPLECPEDVDDPHSWVMKTASEWGVVGLAGLLAMMIGVSRRLARGGEDESRPAGPDGIEAGAVAGGSVILWCATIGGVILAWWIWLCLGVNLSYVAMTLCALAFPWVIGFMALAIEGTVETSFADDEPGLVFGGIGAGLIGFVLHGGIDLSLFRSGAATTFFAMMAVALALRGERYQSRNREGAADGERVPHAAGPLPHGRASDSANVARSVQPIALAVAIIGAAGIAVFIGLIVWPAARLGGYLQDARREVRASSWDAYVQSAGYHAYRSGMDCYRLDGTAVDELTEELVKRVASVEQVDSVISLNEELHHRDPADSAYWHYLATLFSRRYAFGHDVADIEKSVAAMREAVAAYPTSPKRHLSLADLLEGLAQVTSSAEARREAAAELQTVLDLDAKRIYVSKPHRMTEEQRARIAEHINRSRSVGETPG